MADFIICFSIGVMGTLIPILIYLNIEAWKQYRRLKRLKDLLDK